MLEKVANFVSARGECSRAIECFWVEQVAYLKEYARLNVTLPGQRFVQERSADFKIKDLILLN